MERAKREYSTSGLAVSFAAQGVSIDTIARALVVAESQVVSVVTSAYERGVLAAMPPKKSGDVRSSMQVELVNLREHLAEAQALIREFAAKKENGAANYRDVVGLTWVEARMVHSLVSNGRVSKDRLFTEIYGMKNPKDQPEPKILDVFICKIRRKLAPHGIEIRTVWGFGWEISADNITRVKTLAGVNRIESPPLAPEMAAAS